VLGLYSAYSNAYNQDIENRTFSVTHPFHPLFEREFVLVSYRSTWSSKLVFFHDDTGKLCSIPASWTSVLPPDPFVSISNGRSPFRVDNLLELYRLIQEISTGEMTLKEGVRKR